MTDQQFSSTWAITDGAQNDNGKQEIIDNRIRLEVDPKKVETWEVMVFEDTNATTSELLMIFARYAVNANGPLSPDLPDVPLDELTKEQRREIMKSDAFRALRRFPLPSLRAAALSFVEQAREGLAPK
jgi:hypothetical protein